MTNIDLYMDNSHQASVPYPLSSIDTSVNTDADADADAPCGTALIVTRKMRANVTQNIFSGMFHITTWQNHVGVVKMLIGCRVRDELKVLWF